MRLFRGIPADPLVAYRALTLLRPFRSKLCWKVVSQSSAKSERMPTPAATTTAAARGVKGIRLPDWAGLVTPPRAWRGARARASPMLSQTTSSSSRQASDFAPRQSWKVFSTGTTRSVASCCGLGSDDACLMCCDYLLPLCDSANQSIPLNYVCFAVLSLAFLLVFLALLRLHPAEGRRSPLYVVCTTQGRRQASSTPVPEYQRKICHR